MLKIVLVGIGAALLAVFIPRLYAEARYRAHIYPLAAAPNGQVAIVFGAGLRRNGRPTPVLYDRIATAVELYRSGKVEKLLMSGDGLSNAETSAMRQAALELDVPESAILVDPGGLDTYATCYRAKAVFGVERALLVTQNFHLPRALFICDALGLAAVGVSADRRPYRQVTLNFWNFREVLATANAWWELNVTRPTPIP